MRRQLISHIRTALLAVCAFCAFAPLDRAADLSLLDATSELDAIAQTEPAWARKNANRGIWIEFSEDAGRANASPNFDVINAEYGFASSCSFDGANLDDSETFNASGSFETLDPFEIPFAARSRRNAQNSIFRAQIQPPVVSPTTDSYNYGGKTYTFESASNVDPPAALDDGRRNPTTLRRLFKYQQDLSASAAYIPRSNDGLGVFEVGGRLFFAFPCEVFRSGRINKGVFRLTPNFDFTSMSLPKNKTLGLDVPKNLFNAGLSTSFSLDVEDFVGEIEVQVGVASQFKKITGDAFYIRGRAEGSLPVDDDRRLRILGGVAYYDRIKYKLVPVVGALWSPNDKNEFRLVFPDPHWGHFLTKVNSTDWWFFAHGYIGGGTWLMSDTKHKIGNKTAYNFDYDDYRVGVGLRFDCPQGLKGSFEVGGAFGREIKTKAGTLYKPKDSVYLSGGIFF